jgi:hypothetical protein
LASLRVNAAAEGKFVGSCRRDGEAIKFAGPLTFEREILRISLHTQDAVLSVTTLVGVGKVQNGMLRSLGPEVVRPRWVLKLNHVCRLESLRAPHDFELDGRTFLKATITVSLDRGKVYEDVLATLPLDKTIPLACIEPFNGSLLTIVTHVYFYSLLIVGAVSSVLHFRG